MSAKKPRIGLWMVGAGGGVGGTVALGVVALSRNRTEPTGLVTALPQFASAGLIDVAQIVVGGHEIRPQSLLESVRALHAESNVVSRETIDSCAASLRRMQRNIRPGIVCGSTPNVEKTADQQCIQGAPSPASAVEVVRCDLEAFRARHRLDHVVVVNVASSEPPIKRNAAHATYSRLRRAMSRRGSVVLPSSALYALGAFSADCSYINFTPSVGMRIKAIEEFARTREVLFMGRDGKTGETLLKSVLAPMFATRNLMVHSWIGHNVLGNRDGETLSNPKVKASKVRSKDALLPKIVGYTPDMRTSIEYVPSLADWKIAWDFIHFEGFLKTKMSMQFVWTGSDSILAAPLVIDLVRLTALEYVRGRRGRMEHLACFFKDPNGVKEHRYFEQWRRLVEQVTAPVPTGRR